MISEFFIKRPVFAFVVAIVMSLVGLLSLLALPVSEYPDIVPPQVQIAATYPGADALTMQNTVLLPIETDVNGVKDAIYLASISADTGQAVTTVTFRPGTSGNLNTLNTQIRESWASAQLPSAVQQQGLIVKEKSASILMTLAINSPGGTYDALFLNNFIHINILNEIARIPGISDTKLLGDRLYSMRIWLNPDKMASLGLTVNDVINALNSQSIQVSAGSLGSTPAPASQQFRYVLVTQGRMITEREFVNIILRSGSGTSQVYLKDIARIELGAQDYSSYVTLNGKPAAMMAIYQYSDANSLDIAEQCRATMRRLSANFPHDLAYGFPYDTTLSVKASLREMVITLIEAVLLVMLVTFVFLQDWRATLVPTIAIPVSLLATFTVLALAGYSINLISLFGFILAIGIVVDDAILVIENVNRLMETEKLSPREAALKSMRQVTSPIIATTMVLMSMFVPICFLSGITGAIYRQFGITIALAVGFSAINALTLSPVLAALLLKPKVPGKEPNRFTRAFNRLFEKMTSGYGTLVKRLIRIALLATAAYLGASFFILKMVQDTPTGFIPDEDRGVFYVNIQLPPNASLPRTAEVSKRVRELIQEEEKVRDIVMTNGFSIFIGSTSVNNAWGIATLKPWEERTSPEQSQFAIMARLQKKLHAEITEAQVTLINRAAIQGLGSTGGFNFVVMDTSGTDPAKMGDTLQRIIEEASKRPEFFNIFTAYQANTAQYFARVDRRKAMMYQVAIGDINTALENFTGSAMVNLFNRYDQVYQVMLQAEQEFRMRPEDVKRIWVKNAAGNMVPLSALVTFRKELMPQYLARYNTFSSANLQGQQAAGYSSGQAMDALEEVAKKLLPPEMRFDWTEMSYQERLARGQGPMVAALALVFIYLFLAALYESWMLPFSVLLSVPVAFFGAVVFLRLGGIDLNLYTQVGLVLLIGMAAKTAILIVEFARFSHKDDGLSVEEAAEKAARLRFRAVLMTAISFILGLFPLMIASGAGAISRRAVGFAVVGGMLFSVLIGTFFIPTFYVIIQRLINRFRK